MDDLVAFLRARLDEDEQIARTAIDPKHPGDWAWRKDTNSTVRTHKGVPVGPASRGVDLGPHIARWNPARVLRDVEAKGRIIKRHFRRRAPDWDQPGVTGFECAQCLNEYPCPTLRLLALPYADHPDYREEWRPAE